MAAKAYKWYKFFNVIAKTRICIPANALNQTIILHVTSSIGQKQGKGPQHLCLQPREYARQKELHKDPMDCDVIQRHNTQGSHPPTVAGNYLLHYDPLDQLKAAQAYRLVGSLSAWWCRGVGRSVCRAKGRVRLFHSDIECCRKKNWSLKRCLGWWTSLCRPTKTVKCSNFRWHL